LNLIDCDVHVRWQHLDEILEHLPEPWRGRAQRGQMLYQMDGYHNVTGLRRRDATPPNGGSPGSDPHFTLTDLVERYQMDYAVLIGESAHLAVSSLADPDWAAALATAYNQWFVQRWFAVDKRFVGSIIVAPQDPAAAAREIERAAEHPQFVQVTLSAGARFPYGQRFYHPIYAAAERHNLPVAIHIGADGAGINTPPTGAGYPAHYIEWHTTLTGTLQAHLVSLLCEGVFELFPRLKFVIVEGGIAWLPPLLWRLDKNWKSLRAEVPWVKRRPSEYAADHVRLTTQPLEEPDNPKHLLQLLEMFPAERMLMFASDYPHWDFDNPLRVFEHWPETLKQRVAAENARELYRL
jgi:predicted TIM-barrel fold metal-dependent hydrolase